MSIIWTVHFISPIYHVPTYVPTYIKDAVKRPKGLYLNDMLRYNVIGEGKKKQNGNMLHYTALICTARRPVNEETYHTLSKGNYGVCSSENKFFYIHVFGSRHRSRAQGERCIN